MKKFLAILVLGLLFFSNVNAEERESELNYLFKLLKNSEATKAIEIENKICLSVNDQFVSKIWRDSKSLNCSIVDKSSPINILFVA